MWKAGATYTAWWEVSHCQSPFVDVESSDMTDDNARGEQHDVKETHSGPSPGEARVARMLNGP